MDNLFFFSKERAGKVLDRLDALERECRRLTAVVQDQNERLQQWYWRLVKRMSPGAQVVIPATPPISNGLDPISERILARRNAGRPRMAQDERTQGGSGPPTPYPEEK